MSKILNVLSASVLASIMTVPVYAIPQMPGKIYHPIHYKPNVSNLLPTGLRPKQVKTAYGINQITSRGEGQVIAIIDAYDHPNIEQDLAVFSKTFGLRPCTTANGCFTKVYANGTRPQMDPGWAGEIALDVEWVHAIAPAAKIILVETKDANPSSLYGAIQVAVQHGANVISMSWGAPEFSIETEFDQYFQVPGVTFVASSGDSGSGVDYPAASPYVIAAGGTTLTTDSSGNFISETAWSGSGGGVSAYETAPTYQRNFPIPNNPTHMRGVPDVAYNADPNTGYSVYYSIPNPPYPAGWQVVGGTSAAAPQWAAFIAIVNSTVGKVTDVGNQLYQAASKNYGLNYHDITMGTNGSCGYYCTAQPGYDYVTGIGSPQANNLIKALKRSLKI